MRYQFKPLVYLPVILGGVALAVILAFLFGFFVMLLWNWLMPDIFGLGTITYWQSWGLVLLAHLLFKAGHVNSHNRKHDDKWKDTLKNRFSKRFGEEYKGNSQGDSQNNKNKEEKS